MSKVKPRVVWGYREPEVMCSTARSLEFILNLVNSHCKASREE